MRKLSILLMVALLLCGCAQDRSSQSTEATLPTDLVEIGSSGYYAVTGESEVHSTEGLAIKAFSHRVYTPEFDYAVTLTTTVTGTHSLPDHTAAVTAFTASLSEAQMAGFTLSEHISGDTAMVVLYLNQISVCHFQYRVHADGTIEYL